MQIINHPYATHVIGKPSDLTDDQCAPLPVGYIDAPEGPFTVSFWQPTALDLVNLNAGGCVTLFVRAAGRQHPVVSVGTLEKVDV